MYLDVQASEDYKNRAKGMKGSLDKVNALLKQSHIEINDEMYDIEIFVCSNYTAHM